MTLRAASDKMGRGKEPEPGSVPEKGDRLCWTLFEHAQRGGPKLPDPEDTPWTHGGPPGAADAAPRLPTVPRTSCPPSAAAPLPDPVTSEDLL